MGSRNWGVARERCLETGQQPLRRVRILPLRRCRTRGTPVFRFLKVDAVPQAVTVVVEHGGTETMGPQREQFFLRRNRTGRLLVERRMLVE